ncbi:MAG TPA: hypothetical protein VFJ10_05490 [Acidobacteriaceae bacterium]|nr:hypothetical protein [Acidobacteriaceae bacterium]
MRKTPLDELIGIVMGGHPRKEPSEIGRLLAQIVGPDLDPRNAAELMDRFQSTMGQIELGYITFGDAGDPIYLRRDRSECLAILRELGNALH